MQIDRVKLIAEMARRRMTTLDLVEKSGVSRSTITAIRCGKHCHSTTAAHIARALGVSVDDLKED